MGFEAEILSRSQKNAGLILKDVYPHDLVKYGLIPELVGRLPLVVSLESLDENAFIQILTEPKNAITKQYKKLFELDSIDLEFDKEALLLVAKMAFERNTGARGLRAILEEKMTNLMYEAPSIDNLNKVIITKEFIEGEKAMYHTSEQRAIKETDKKKARQKKDFVS
ncbi:ATP-dependent Clp protease ATP-binding subunit ClpX [bioreactor metagenome]|uniref:ATP-dependent Clp protease ATP-binding subunit ClpX n=1 Tax=bioreactor metagenome TaxID=1076179 RepID=A0A645HPP6_9ZZZZ